ncbi:hypothetical protein [Rugosimonospora acidiphila]
MKVRISHALLVPLALVAVSVATACTTAARPVTVARSAAVARPGPVASANTGPDLGRRSPEGGYWPQTVQLGQNPSLGQVVVDGQGFTLYRFDRDSASPPASNCSGACSTQWPPVLANDTLRFQNLDPARLGTVTRQDGTQQVTVGGQPVYRFAQDQVPGQTRGQGSQGVWFAVAPDGGKAAPPGDRSGA